jgi:hypothetical protein
MHLPVFKISEKVTVHRRDAKDAEMFFLFFAVDPPKIPVDIKDGKE